MSDDVVVLEDKLKPFIVGRGACKPVMYRGSNSMEGERRTSRDGRQGRAGVGYLEESGCRGLRCVVLTGVCFQGPGVEGTDGKPEDDG